MAVQAVDGEPVFADFPVTQGKYREFPARIREFAFPVPEISGWSTMSTAVGYGTGAWSDPLASDSDQAADWTVS
jgi:hypothetical protein